MLNAVNSLRSAAANVLFKGEMHLGVCLVLRCVYATVISQCIEIRYVYLKRSFIINFRILCSKNVCLERLGPKSQPFSDE